MRHPRIWWTWVAFHPEPTVDASPNELLPTCLSKEEIVLLLMCSLCFVAQFGSAGFLLLFTGTAKVHLFRFDNSVLGTQSGFQFLSSCRDSGPELASGDIPGGAAPLGVAHPGADVVCPQRCQLLGL